MSRFLPARHPLPRLVMLMLTRQFLTASSLPSREPAPPFRPGRAIRFLNYVHSISARGIFIHMVYSGVNSVYTVGLGALA